MKTTIRSVLVTGASGFIGAAVAATLVASGRRVIAACRDVDKAKRKLADLGDAASVMHWDMKNPLACPDAVDAVVHAAGQGDPASYSRTPATTMRDTLTGCLHALECAVAKGAGRFVLISSGEVYGAADPGRKIRETDRGPIDPLHPRSVYPLGKAAAESLALGYYRQFELPVVIARLCHVYGPGMDSGDSRIACQFPLAAARGGDIVLKSAGDQRRSLCYIDDAARAVLAILDHATAGEAYNVADENAEMTVRDFAERTARAAGVAVVFDPSTEAERRHFNPMPQAVFDTAKLRRLGWRAGMDVEDGIARTVRFFSDQRFSR